MQSNKKDYLNLTQTGVTYDLKDISFFQEINEVFTFTAYRIRLEDEQAEEHKKLDTDISAWNKLFGKKKIFDDLIGKDGEIKTYKAFKELLTRRRDEYAKVNHGWYRKLKEIDLEGQKDESCISDVEPIGCLSSRYDKNKILKKDGSAQSRVDKPKILQMHDYADFIDGLINKYIPTDVLSRFGFAMDTVMTFTPDQSIFYDLDLLRIAGCMRRHVASKLKVMNRERISLMADEDSLKVAVKCGFAEYLATYIPFFEDLRDVLDGFVIKLNCEMSKVKISDDLMGTQRSGLMPNNYRGKSQVLVALPLGTSFAGEHDDECACDYCLMECMKMIRKKSENSAFKAANILHKCKSEDGVIVYNLENGNEVFISSMRASKATERLGQFFMRDRERFYKIEAKTVEDKNVSLDWDEDGLLLGMEVNV